VKYQNKFGNTIHKEKEVLEDHWPVLGAGMEQKDPNHVDEQDGKVWTRFMCLMVWTSEGVFMGGGGAISTPAERLLASEERLCFL
jgi:hypothetical protein